MVALSAMSLHTYFHKTKNNLFQKRKGKIYRSQGHRRKALAHKNIVNSFLKMTGVKNKLKIRPEMRNRAKCSYERRKRVGETLLRRKASADWKIDHWKWLPNHSPLLTTLWSACFGKMFVEPCSKLFLWLFLSRFKSFRAAVNWIFYNDNELRDVIWTNKGKTQIFNNTSEDESYLFATKLITKWPLNNLYLETTKL